jgi:hypothetical protein
MISFDNLIKENLKFLLSTASLLMQINHLYPHLFIDLPES